MIETLSVDGSGKKSLIIIPPADFVQLVAPAAAPATPPPAATALPSNGTRRPLTLWSGPAPPPQLDLEPLLPSDPGRAAAAVARAAEWDQFGGQPAAGDGRPAFDLLDYSTAVPKELTEEQVLAAAQRGRRHINCHCLSLTSHRPLAALSPPSPWPSRKVAAAGRIADQIEGERLEHEASGRQWWYEEEEGEEAAAIDIARAEQEEMDRRQQREWTVRLTAERVRAHPCPVLHCVSRCVSRCKR